MQLGIFDNAIWTVDDIEEERMSRKLHVALRMTVEVERPILLCHRSSLRASSILEQS
jgi:hypothetical protein